MSFWRNAMMTGVLLICILVSCRKRNDSPVIKEIPDKQDTSAPGGNDTLPSMPIVNGYNQRAVLTAINANVGGFYEALPPGYDSTNNSYPLLVFLHGGGELGNGNADLPLVLYHAVPRMLHEKRFPVKFLSGDSTYSFIIISPQFAKWPEQADVHAVITYAKANYRVNAHRIYLSGLSMGGGATWEYGAQHGSDLAAIVPISGASWPDSTITKKIALTNVPAWAFHNKDDSAVTYFSTTKYVGLINFYKPDPLVKMTIWENGGHDAWTRATDTLYKEEGKNIYEWMLQFKR